MSFPPNTGPYPLSQPIPTLLSLLLYMFCLLTENRNAFDSEDKEMYWPMGEGEDQATSVYPPAIYCPDFIITKVFVFPSHASWNSFATFVLVGWSLVLKSLVAFVNCDSRDERNLQVGVALKTRDQWRTPPKVLASASAIVLALDCSILLFTCSAN